MNAGRFSFLDAILLAVAWALAIYAGWPSLTILAICLSGWCGGALLELAGTKSMSMIGGLVRALSGFGGTISIIAVLIQAVQKLFF
jgi:hypothetical protein